MQIELNLQYNSFCSELENDSLLIPGLVEKFIEQSNS